MLLKLFVYLSLFLQSYSLGNIVISSPFVTNWGTWGNWERCPNGTYAVAFQLKTEDYVGSDDDTALNGIRLFCDTPGENGLRRYISSSISDWGRWGQVFYCEGLVTGFQLRSEDPLSRITKGVDNTAANNLKAFCATSNIKKQIVEGDGQVWGSWTRAQNCLPRQAACGIRTQVEEYVGSNDDTALNNVQMECCDIVDPSKTCNPTDNWELLIECDNSEGLVPLKCTFEKINGISVSHSDSSSEMSESSTMVHVGFTISYVGESLSSNFKTNLDYSSVTQHSWKTESSQTWNEETGHKAEFEVGPGMVSSLFQVVGKCKYFDVYTSKFRKRDTVHSTCEVTDRIFVWN